MILDEYIDYLKNLNVSSQTIRQYYYELKKFIDFLKCNRVDVYKVDNNILFKFLNNKTPYSKAKVISILSSFYAYLLKQGKINENPIRIDYPKLPKKVPKYLNDDELYKVFDYILNSGNVSIRDQAIMLIFINCGLRLSEVVNLNVQDVYQDYLVVNGKGNKQRIVYFDNITAKILQTYIGFRQKYNLQNNALFVSTVDGSRLSARRIQDIVKSILKKAGVYREGLSCHKLRHTYCTQLYKNGVDIFKIKELMGHSSLSTTMRYTHISNEAKKQIVSKLPINNFAK